MNFYKDIVHNLPEGVIICDDSFKIIEINAAIEVLLNYKKEDLLNKYSYEILLIDKKNCPICQKSDNHKFIPEQYAHLAEIIDKAGNKIPIRVKHQTYNNIIISVITPLADIAFLNQAHIDFVSTVSHELRTPLTSIKGFADTLLTAGSRLTAEQQKRFISIIKSQVDRLTRLVENLLTVSRLESQKDKTIYKAINFKQFIQPVLSTIAHKAQDHTINLDIYPHLPPLWADSDKFEQVMTNLIDNAIKYSNKNTTITIQALFAENDSEFVNIKVKDQGVGIPSEFLPKIFTKFSRIDNPLTRHVEGTGLGLYITKSLVESMGGNISVSSDDSGTTFTVKLPVATPENQACKKFHKQNKSDKAL